MNDLVMEILKFPLSFLKLSWQHSTTNTSNLALSTTIYPLLSTVVLVTILIQIFNAKGDVESLVKNIQAFGVYAEVLGKFLSYRVYRKELYKLVEDTHQFWRTERCSSDIKAALDDVLRKTLIVQKIFSAGSIFCIALILAAPIFTKQLPLGIWCLDKDQGIFFFSLVVQEICLAMVGVYVVAFDGIFLGFCINLILQFKILNSSLQDLNLFSISTAQSHTQFHYMENLTLCIRQQVYLLQFSKKLKYLCSPVLLIEYVTVALILCAEMYALFDSSNLDVGNSLNHLFRMLILTVQLAFYCMPIDYLTDEAIKTSDRIYETHWYGKSMPLLRNTFTIIMQRSQKEIEFKAGGLVDINSRALLTVFKVGWSICMLLRGLKK